MILEEVMCQEMLSLYELGGKIDLISVVKRDKNSIGGNECVVFWYHLP